MFMIRPLRFAAFAVIVVSLVQACMGWQPLPPPEDREAACERFFDEMDRRADESGVADAEAVRVAGFPELRVDRFLASFADGRLAGEAYVAWVERLRKLDDTARRIEWRNRPAGTAARLQAPFGLDAGTAIEFCGQVLAERDLKSPARRSGLLQRAQVPDAYSTWQRVLGLYPLTRWAIVEGVGRVQRELRQPFIAGSGRRPDTGPWVRYAPPAPAMLGAAVVARMLEASAANPLGIPEPSEARLDRLFAAFAPVWAVETASDSDRIGAARVGTDGTAYIDPAAPVVYRLASHTRRDGRVLLQLNYLVWFPARPPQGALDIYAGRFDGLIWRVTLGTAGRPLVYDSIHPCGCYYQIFPGEGVRVVQPEDGSEPTLSPAPIPRLKPDERLVIRLASRTHFIRGVTPERTIPAPVVYGWLDYDELRSLPAPNGRHRSLFGADGLVRGSERPERFLLWPMGVPSAGAMRQWGTHAIAFLGKRQFDDPDLPAKFLRPIRE
jgi:hypothetical protein